MFDKLTQRLDFHGTALQLRAERQRAIALYGSRLIIPVGNKINIGYREFQGGMARAAFSNEVEYDLSESKTIRYKGAVLDIMDANNQSITFKLTRNFNTN